jgi:succinate-semialdehyde dehydrogenase / glutarate-semialdehyde dehydrogenase
MVVSRFLPRANIFVRAMSSAVKPSLKNPALFREQSLVNGKWINAKSGEVFPVFDPATGNKIGDCPEHTAEEYAAAVEQAREAFDGFKKFTHRERSNMLKRWSQLLTENVDDLAKILSWENGKPLAEAKGEIAVCALNFDWFAEEAPRIYGETIPSQAPDVRIHTIKQPIGVCAIITPWNFPASMISRKVGAAVAAGCSSVIKPAAETPYSALAMAYLGEEAGIPKGVINVLTTNKNVKDVGRELCEHKLVAKVSFTGSTNVGKVLMRQAASTVKKVSFELGGNAPFIVFGDADVSAAAEGAVASRFRGSGQTCICANRFYVHEDVYDEFAEKFAAKVAALKVGPGLAEGTQQGPLINKAGIDKVARHVEDAVNKQGKVLTGGKRLTEIGENFYAPTVIANGTAEMVINKEETFGPLAVLIKFKTFDEVVKLANDTEYGLAAYVYSRNISNVHKITEALEVGMIGVNRGLITESSLPFGGVKESGFGRETSKYGLDDYLVIKSVAVAL